MRCYCFLGSIWYNVRKKTSDKHERILIIEALIDDIELMLIDLHNANAENDQLTTFSEPTNLLENCDLTKNKPIIFTGDFNLFPDRSLEAKGGNPCLQKQSLSNLLHIKGESEILKQNNILLGHNISLVLFKGS